MEKIIVDDKLYVIFDNSVWEAWENFQGNNITFVKRDNVHSTSVPTVSISRKKGVNKKIDIVYRYTVRELRKILSGYEEKVLERDADSIWFEYSGLFESRIMKFSQKISIEAGLLSSITWGAERDEFDNCSELFSTLLSGIQIVPDEDINCGSIAFEGGK